MAQNDWWMQVGSPELTAPVEITPDTPINTIIDRMQAGGYLRVRAGVYDLSAMPNDTVLANPLRMKGDGASEVVFTVGGPAQGFQERALVRNSLYLEGISFIDGAIPFSIQGLDTTIDTIQIRSCAASNITALIHHDSTSPNPAARVTNLDFSDNVITNCNSGVHMRMGSGGVNPIVLVEYGRFNNNYITTADKYGIVVGIDNPQTPWTLEGYATAAGNRFRDIEGRSGSTVTGFGLNLSAYKEWHAYNCLFQDMAAGDRVALEPLYSKSLRTHVSECIFVDCHDQEGGGAVSNKADDNGQICEIFDVEGCTFLNTDTANKRMRYAIWIEGSNTYVKDCIFRGAIRSCIATSGVTDISHINMQDCMGRMQDCGGSESGVPYRSLTFFNCNRNNMEGVVYKGNDVTALDSTVAGNPYRMLQLDVGSGETVNSPVIQGNILRKAAAMTNTAVGIRLNKSAGGVLSDAQILDNHFDALDTGIELSGTALDGTTRIRLNSEVGVTTDVNNASASTLDEALNSWN